MSHVSSPTGAVVVDANIPIAIVTSEPGEPKETAAINQYAGQNYEFYAPGALLAETLYVLCGKLQDSNLTPTEHNQAIQDLDAFMKIVQSPPNGESVLMLRSEGDSRLCREDLWGSA
jgi:predicted nucleic acid-binding protein